MEVIRTIKRRGTKKRRNRPRRSSFLWLVIRVLCPNHGGHRPVPVFHVALPFFRSLPSFLVARCPTSLNSTMYRVKTCADFMPQPRQESRKGSACFAFLTEKTSRRRQMFSDHLSAIHWIHGIFFCTPSLPHAAALLDALCFGELCITRPCPT